MAQHYGVECTSLLSEEADARNAALKAAQKLAAEGKPDIEPEESDIVDMPDLEDLSFAAGPMDDDVVVTAEMEAQVVKMLAKTRRIVMYPATNIRVWVKGKWEKLDVPDVGGIYSPKK